MPEIRVKASCAPCRQRKSKCDAQLPCSSCTLRGTQDGCFYPAKKRRASTVIETPRSISGSNDPSPNTHSHAYQPPTKRSNFGSSSNQDGIAESSSAATRRALAEISRLKESIGHLEEHVRELSSNQTGNLHDIAPASVDHQRNWERVKGLIPEKAIVEVLLEYFMIECDWLWHTRDLEAVWQSTIARGGCSSPIAGLLCMSLAFPALFLGREQTPLYRIPLDASKLHFNLYTAARSFITTTGDLDELELLLGLIYYSIYFGQIAPLMEFTVLSLKVATSGGWFDESDPRWYNISVEERMSARRLICNLASTCRWQRLFLRPDPLAHIRINICRPSYRPNTLSRPIHLNLPGRKDLSFRVFRLRTQEELDRIATNYQIHDDIPDLIVQARDYLIELQQWTSQSSPSDIEKLLAHCESVHREIARWREIHLPSQGFPMTRVEDIDLTSPQSCQKAAQSLIVHHAMGHIDATILRHWLDIAPGQSTPSPLHAYLHRECILNAERSMETISPLRALLSTRYAPFVTSFAAGNLFNAATCFAVPVLRAVHQWSSKSQEEDIRRLPAWPDDREFGHRGEDSSVLSQQTVQGSSQETLPATIYIDSQVKRYANNILVILDVLTTLKASPLEDIAEARLATLIQRYGLRDSQAFPFADTTPPVAQTAPNPADIGVGQALNAGLGGLTDFADFGVSYNDDMRSNGANHGGKGDGLVNFDLSNMEVMNAMTSAAIGSQQGRGPILDFEMRQGQNVAPSGIDNGASASMPQGTQSSAIGDQSFWDELFNVDPGIWEGLLKGSNGLGHEGQM